MKEYLKNVHEETLRFWPIYLLAIILFAQHAWVPGFFIDGHLYAAFGKHAAEKGHWLVPYLSRTLYPDFHHHSPFIFILEGVFFLLFGSGYTQARLFSCLFAIILVAKLVETMRKKSETLAYWCGFFLIVTPPFFKKVRFPNMDIPLALFVFLALLSFLKVLDQKKEKAWYHVGFFAGLALLTKGPMALLIPLIIAFMIFLKKEWRLLVSPHPWLGFVLALGLFSLWPLLLELTGQYHIFERYLKMTFVDSIVRGRGRSLEPLTYIVFLFKQCLPWMLLFIFSLVKMRKKIFQDNLWLLASVTVSIYIIFLSLQKLQYSHYIMPAYPWLAIIAGSTLWHLTSEKLKRGEKLLHYLVPVIGTVLLVFPLTTKIRRDAPVLKTIRSSQFDSQKDRHWMIVQEAYPYYTLAHLIGYELSGEVYLSTDQTFINWVAGNKPTINNKLPQIFIIRKKLFIEFYRVLVKKFMVLYESDHKDFVILKRYL